MKARDLAIATALIILLGTLLSGCQPIEPEKAKVAGKTVIEEFVMKAVAAKKEVKLNLKSEKVGKEVKVSISLENPNLKPITSVQSWLSYDPALLKGVKVEAKGSAFEMTAPYDNNFDTEAGLVRIGRASPRPITEKTIAVAEVTFEPLGEGAAAVDAYDYQDDLGGHTSANAMVDGKPFNILVKPESPALVIQ